MTNDTQKPKGKRGGRRPGAGRPKMTEEQKITGKTLYLSKDKLNFLTTKEEVEELVDLLLQAKDSLPNRTSPRTDKIRNLLSALEPFLDKILEKNLD
jgi:hypothetical protein